MPVLLIILFSPFPAQAASIGNLDKDGVVRFFVYHTGEGAELKYSNGRGEWLAGAEGRVGELLRSRADEKKTVIDRRLIELADHLQDHFQVDTIEVISGYRSREFNDELKETGHSVARESFHTKGMAMDIHVDEIQEDTLRDYLISLGLGGVGYYGNKLMVHMDFGPVRQWQDGKFSENTEIGVFNTASGLKLRTDRLNYRLNSNLVLTISRVPTGVLQLTLQKFFRGKWGSVKPLAMTENVLGFSLTEKFLRGAAVFPSVYGKYRVRFENGDDWQHSNEFYVKKM